MKQIRCILIFTIIAFVLVSCKKQEKVIIEDIRNLEDQDVKGNEPVEDLEVVDEIAIKVDSMNIDEKIGQLIIAGFEGQEISDEVKSLISKYKIGGFILFARNIKDSQQTRHLLNDLKYENSNNDYPLFLSIDEEGGRVSRLPSDYKKLPTALEVGNKDSEKISRELGELLGHRVKSLGFNLDFAPVLDIYSNPKNTVIGNRAFGKTVKQASDNAINVMQGIRDSGVIPTVKHFPGHGDTIMDSHLNLPKVKKTLEELKSFEIKPFESAISNDVPIIMIAHILYPDIDEEYPSSMSFQIIENILRRDLSYNGVVISDDMTMGAISNNYTIEEATIKFLKAGGDIALICHGESNTINVINRVKEEVESGEISIEELDCKVYRVLKLKSKYGLEDSIIDNIDFETLNKETSKFLSEFK